MTWRPGRDRIVELIAAGELEQVAADQGMARRLLEDARRHLDSAAAAAGIGDLTGAYQLAYDAFRKSAASLLAAQGLRATSRGGHVAVQDAVITQFGSSLNAFRALGRIRRTRNSFEYPDTDTAGPTSDDVEDAVTAATQAHAAAVTVLEQNVLTPWR